MPKRTLIGRLLLCLLLLGPCIAGAAVVEQLIVVINGEPGIAAFFEDRLLSVISIRTDGQRILDVFSILNPDKLRGLALEPVTTEAARASWW